MKYQCHFCKSFKVRMCKFRPTPPHLTSVLAEQLLARACENEADNAKRMRMGMEPVSQVVMMVLVVLMVMLLVFVLVM